MTRRLTFATFLAIAISIFIFLPSLWTFFPISTSRQCRVEFTLSGYRIRRVTFSTRFWFFSYAKSILTYFICPTLTITFIPWVFWFTSRRNTFLSYWVPSLSSRTIVWIWTISTRDFICYFFVSIQHSVLSIQSCI